MTFCCKLGLLHYMCTHHFKESVDHVAELNGHVSSVKAVDINPNIAISASRDRTLKVWSLENLRRVGNDLGMMFYL